jgi:hypothetical protein
VIKCALCPATILVPVCLQEQVQGASNLAISYAALVYRDHSDTACVYCIAKPICTFNQQAGPCFTYILFFIVLDNQ